MCCPACCCGPDLDWRPYFDAYDPDGPNGGALGFYGGDGTEPAGDGAWQQGLEVATAVGA